MKPPGTLWATPDLLRDSLPFYFNDQDLVGAVPDIFVHHAVCEASLVFAECSTEGTEPVIRLISLRQRQ
jgi:hypothetical protein